MRKSKKRRDKTHELTVNVSTDGDWTPHGLDVGLLHQNLPSLTHQTRTKTDV